MSFWNKLFKFTPKTPRVQPVTKDIKETQDRVEACQAKDKTNDLPKPGNYKFSKTSRSRLATCHPDIQRVCNMAIQYIDFGVSEGSRPKDKQDEYFAKGTSKVKYPNSYHNTIVAHIKDEFKTSTELEKECSLAVDLFPVPLDWNDTDSFVELARIVKICAKELDIPLDWGFDLWRFDLPHYQLTSYRKKNG